MKKTNLPSTFYSLFQWFCKPDLFEELQGDLEEAFKNNRKIYGSAKARAIYRKEVLKMIRPSVIGWRTPSYFNHTIMLRNYFKTAYRSMMKNPLSAFINVFGLSAAIGVCVLFYGFAQWVYRADQFHEYKDEVYLVTFFADRDGTLQQVGRTPRPLGEMLSEDFAGISRFCRVEDRNVVVRHGDNVFHEQVRLTDPEFLEMFTFPLKWGHAASLNDMNSIILSEAMAVKYFGTEDPTGREMLVKFDQGRNKTFRITGVARAFPESRTFDFDFLINLENLKTASPEYDFNDWSKLVNATFIQVKNPADLGHIRQGMNKYRQLQNQVRSDWEVSAFGFEQLATLHENASNIRDNISWGNDDNFASIVFGVIVGTILLVLACFNYMNIAIVSAAKRFKEIGLRKVIGASRRMVVVQFLCENILMTFFALLVGFLLGVMVFIPWFEQMNRFSMDFRLMDPKLLIFLPAILLVTGIISGSYPALYISRFQVVGILKGAVKFGKRNPVTKVLLGFQLVLACILIATAVMFTQNATYIADRSWGYDQDEALYIHVPGHSAYEQLSAVIAQDPNVLSYAGTNHHLGRNHTTIEIDMPDRAYEVDQLSVAPEYFQTMRLELKAGRFFNPYHESDKQTVVINELLAENLGLEQPVGQIFKIDSTTYEVVGVVRDFHSYSFYTEIRPTLFRVADPADYRYLAVRVKDGTEREAYQVLQQYWATLFPEIPFQGGYQEDVWGNYFDQISTHGKFWRGMAMIAILLAGLGLYGLVTLNVSGRMKEFSIRKVLGADRKSIARNITRQYLLLFSIGLGIGAPLSYFLVKMVIELAYTYHIPMNFFGVMVSVLMLVMVLIAVVAIQVRKVSKSNPVKGLRVE